MILRPYQQAAIDALYAYFSANDGHPLIVLPTGAGKSVVIAEFVRGIFDRWPGQRVLMLTHVKELIEQNLERLYDVWPDAPVGVHSASLRRHDVYDPILFAGIQSVHRKADRLGHFDLVIVDECHLINHRADGMYRGLLEDLWRINPDMKLIGLTATAFRTGFGDITYGDSTLFTDIAYELTIADLLNQGHLAPLVSKRTAAQIDVSQVRIRQGEFVAKDLEEAVEREGLVESAVAEIIRYGQDRRSWLVFCSGVDHAEHVREELAVQGVPAGCITGDTPKAERSTLIEAFRAGRVRALTNANVLTTGFDAPATDLIAFLRPTCSPGLYVQMAGRGMRNAPGKTNCLVLDFAGNVFRHGPVDQVRPWTPTQRRRTPVDNAKNCPECETIVAIQTQTCPECGYVFFERQPNHEAYAADVAILSMEDDPTRYYVTAEVDSVEYRLHHKPGKIPSLRVDYHCGMRRFSEWVCLEHTGYPRQKAVQWWWTRSGGGSIPETISDALGSTDGLRVPATITINTKPKYPEIIRYGFDAEPQSGNAGNLASSHGDRREPADDDALPPLRLLGER